MRMNATSRDLLFQDPRVRQLLGKFASGEIVDLTPHPDFTYGYRYPVVENIIMEDPEEAVKFLEELHRRGVLEKTLHDQIIVCPYCDSKGVASHYHCPYCDHIQVSNRRLVEHTVCGFIGDEREYVSEKGAVCPSCHKDLGDDYRLVGLWYQCEKCSKQFEAPKLEHICRACERTFSSREVKLTYAYSYKVKGEVLEEFKMIFQLLPSIRKTLEEHRYGVEAPGQIQGNSGVTHTFTILAHVDNDIVAIDVAHSASKASEAVVAMLSKVIDVEPKRSILLVSGVDNALKRLAEQNKISIIETGKGEDVVQKFEKLIE